MSWLLTGGAGYIGAHVATAMVQSGLNPVILDDLSTGQMSRVPGEVTLVKADVRDTRAVIDTMRAHRVDGIVHLAAKKAVGESVQAPLVYYRENVDGAVSLAEAMVACGVRRLVYSSSAAVYGSPDVDLVTEDAAAVPMSPYGETKLAGEWIFRSLGIPYGVDVMALRYFNVAGAGADHLGDTAALNLIPMVLRAVEQGVAPRIFGDDYPTPDGTCIRDYIHVSDLAEAHVAAVRALEEGSHGFTPVNIARGEGSSVRDVISSVSRAMRRDLVPHVDPRRPGDPPRLVACADRAGKVLGWQALRDLDAMTTSAWACWSAMPSCSASSKPRRTAWLGLSSMRTATSVCTTFAACLRRGCAASRGSILVLSPNRMNSVSGCRVREISAPGTTTEGPWSPPMASSAMRTFWGMDQPWRRRADAGRLRQHPVHGLRR